MKRTALAAVLGLALSLLTAQGQGIGIAITNVNRPATISWPLTAYHYLLQSTTNFADANAWNNLGSASPATAAFIGNNALAFTNFTANSILFTQQIAGASQFFRLKGPATVPVFSFTIFYDQALEFSDSATILLNGLIHANGPIYTGPGAGASQTFNGTVTTTGTITSPERGGISYGPNQARFNGRPPFVTNTPAFISGLSGGNPHLLIELPPANESIFSNAGRLRLYNQAQVILLVTNSPAGGPTEIVLTLQRAYDGILPGADSGKLIFLLTTSTEPYLHTNLIIPLPFLSLTNRFADQRQSQSNQLVTQIDVSGYKAWLQTNTMVAAKFTAGAYPVIFYVADCRNTNTAQAVVRLVNGAGLPYNNGLGFTVATMNPLYVKGNYNVTVDSNTYAYTVGSTTNGATVPAALMADAITILSPAWNDGLSAANYSARDAASMTVNAALLCGDVPSTGVNTNNFSGGVHNLPRLLEDWTGIGLVLNTSLVCLFSSQIATNQFQLPGVYYQPPTRLWGFDATFLNPSRLPPGTPVYSLP
jgi:hypothetical protein